MHWQPKTLQALPRVKTVNFPCSSSTEKTLDRLTDWWEQKESRSSASRRPLDFYGLVLKADIKPATMNIGYACLQFAYGAEGEVVSVTATGTGETDYYSMGLSNYKHCSNKTMLLRSIIEKHTPTLQSITMTNIYVADAIFEMLPHRPPSPLLT